jgi:hypothetical protein
MGLDCLVGVEFRRGVEGGGGLYGGTGISEGGGFGGSSRVGRAGIAGSERVGGPFILAFLSGRPSTLPTASPLAPGEGSRFVGSSGGGVAGVIPTDTLDIDKGVSCICPARCAFSCDGDVSRRKPWRAVGSETSTLDIAGASSARSMLATSISPPAGRVRGGRRGGPSGGHAETGSPRLTGNAVAVGVGSGRRGGSGGSVGVDIMILASSISV